jgi:hypothetical protein
LGTTNTRLQRPSLPTFGGDNGIIYPFIARFLQLLTWLSPGRFLGLNATLLDVYILCFLIAEVVIAIVIDRALPSGRHEIGTVVWVGIAIIAFRLVVICAVTLSEFVLGYYRDRLPFPINRGVVHKTINIVELILIYGIFYFVLAKAFPIAARMNNEFNGVFDAVYFSTVTGATLGYGDFFPIGWLSKAVVMTEVLFMILFGLTILSFLKGRAWAPKDTEQTDTEPSSGSKDNRAKTESETEPGGDGI